MKKRREELDYVELGAMMRLYNALGIRIALKMNSIMTNRECSKFERILDKINNVRSECEEHMFRFHPKMTTDYIDVFYGAPDVPPRNRTDTVVLAFMRKTITEIMGENIKP